MSLFYGNFILFSTVCEKFYEAANFCEHKNNCGRLGKTGFGRIILKMTKIALKVLMEENFLIRPHNSCK
jgi:hypothetical protein